MNAGAGNTSKHAALEVLFFAGFVLLLATIVCGMVMAAAAVVVAFGVWSLFIVFTPAAAVISALLQSSKAFFTPFRTAGVRLEPDDAPGLFDLVLSIARELKTAPPSVIYLEPAPVLYSANTGLLRKRRVLGVGAPLLQTLESAEVAALLAQELALVGGKGLVGFAFRLRRTMMAVEAALGATHGRAWAVVGRKVAALLVRPYVRLYLKVSLAGSRAQNLAADARAATVVGSAALASALSRQREGEELYRRYDTEVQHLVRAGYLPEDLAEGFVVFRTNLSHREREQLQASVLARPETPFDFHPPMADRLARLRALALVPPLAPDQRPGVALLADATDLLERCWTAARPRPRTATRLPWSDVAHYAYLLRYRHAAEKYAGRLRDPLGRTTGAKAFTQRLERLMELIEEGEASQVVETLEPSIVAHRQPEAAEAVLSEVVLALAASALQENGGRLVGGLVAPLEIERGDRRVGFFDVVRASLDSDRCRKELARWVVAAPAHAPVTPSVS